MAAAVEAASRAIDKAAGRQFGRVDAPEREVFTAALWRGGWHVDLPDLMLQPTNVATLDGTPIPAYELGPSGAQRQGRPWTAMQFPSLSGPKVAITARWGWSAVPDAITTATLIQAAKIYNRRENIVGPLTKNRVDNTELGWSTGATAGDLDPDALSIVKGFRRLVVAA